MKNTPKSVYVVVCSSGDYEDRYVWLGGIFTYRTSAEGLKKELIKRAQRTKDMFDSKYSKEKLTDEDDDKRIMEWIKKRDILDLNKVLVERYSLNKDLSLKKHE